MCDGFAVVVEETVGHLLYDLVTCVLLFILVTVMDELLFLIT